MRILYDSKSALHKVPFGCVGENEECTITIYIPVSCMTLRSFLVIKNNDGFLMQIPMNKICTKDSYEHYSATFSLYKNGLYFYYFKIETKTSEFSLYKYGYHDTNMEDGSLWQISCIKKNGYNTDKFYSGAVYYQIFPDRFYKEEILSADGKLMPYTIHASESDTPSYLPDENGKILNSDFFGGNLRGIEKKLPYLKELGVDVIYLNPIFFAYSNHRYDTADYFKVDPLLGTNEDFTSLCREAHSLDMRIILDGVFSHTGADSVYFDKYARFGNGAYLNEDSPYASWYSVAPDKSYVSWWGIDTLPCVNELSPSYLDFIIESENSVIAYWLRMGADGFRLDVADELPDEFIARLHKRVHEIKPDAIVIGEVWEDASNKISYGVTRKYFTECELDSVMNYPFRSAIIDFIMGKIFASEFSEAVMAICENYPSQVLNCLMNSLSTHDTPRIINILSGVTPPEFKKARADYILSPDEENTALEREAAAAFLQFMLPGAPSLYYGDEAALQGFEDPFNRKFFPWGSEKNKLFNLYKKLSSLKKSFAQLREGDTFVSGPSEDVIIIKRTLNDAPLYAAVCRKGSYKINGEIIFSNCDGDIISENGFALYR